MKNIKKLLVLVMCVGVLGSMTGCGNNNNADDAADQGTNNTTMEDKNQTNTTTEKKEEVKDKNKAGNTTETDRVDDRDGGVIDNAVHDVTDGIDNMTDDLTGNEHTTDSTR